MDHWYWLVEIQMYPLPTHSLHTQSAISLKKSSLMPSSRSRLHANWAESIENWGLVVSEQVRHQPPQDSYILGGEKNVGGYLFFAQSSRAVSGEIARCPLLSIPGLSNLEFCYQLIISSVKSNQAVQKSSTAWKTCVEMLYYCIFSQLRSTCDNCTVTLVVDILGICYSSYSMILLKKKRKRKLFLL